MSLSPSYEVPWPLLLSSRDLAVKNAAREVNVSKLESVQVRLVRLLDPVRELDWCDYGSTPGSDQKLTTARRRTAALLHRRGEKTHPCKSCCGNSTIWKSCVVFPIYNNMSILSYTCTNCYYDRTGTQCSHRNAFRRTGGRGWAHYLTEDIVNRGGLRYVLAVENRQWQQVQNYQNYPVPPPGVCNNPSPVSLKREHTGESLENFIGPKRPRLLPADGNQDASTSLGPGENIQTPFDGAILPWPVPVSAWNDRDQLRSIIEDFRSFTRVIEARLADLEEPMATTTFWEEQAAKILGDYPSADDYWV